MSWVARLVVLLGFAAVLTVVTALLLFDAPFEYALDCNRLSGRCVFTQRLLVRSKVGWAPMAALGRAEVRVVPARRGAPRILVWVQSRSGSGDSFFADYSRRGEADQAAERINAFLGDPSAGRLVLTRSVRGMYWLAWALVPIDAALVVALAAVLFGKRKAEERPDSNPAASG